MAFPADPLKIAHDEEYEDWIQARWERLQAQPVNPSGKKSYEPDPKPVKKPKKGK